MQVLMGVTALSLAFLAAAQAAAVEPAPGRYFVAAEGRDDWSGTLPAPNPGKTDGPFATPARAQQALRAAKGEKSVYVRAGTYFLPEPLRLTPADSGSRYLAYPGERPVLSGGVPITGWKRGEGNLWVADLPKRERPWGFRRLRVGDEMQICARTPNFDPKDPYKSGFFNVVYQGTGRGAFGATMANIHTPGDWIEWKVTVPAAGDYGLWFLYGALNKPFGRTDMAGQTSFRVDGGEPVLLQNLPDTGSWQTLKWSQTAALRLTAGEHTLRWTNEKGGGLNFDAFALCDDPAWVPEGTKLADPAAGKHVLVVQAEACSAAQGKEMTRPQEVAPAYKDRFMFRPGDITEYPRSPEPEIHIFPAWGWVNTILYVKQIDPAAHTVTVEQNDNASQELRIGNRYFVSNILEGLDSPGEWYLDSAAGRVSYWPKDAGFERRGVVAAVLDRVFDVAGDPAQEQWVEDVVIRGFQISDTTYSRVMPSVYSPQDAAIWLSGARRCVVEGNRFAHVGGHGVALQQRSTGNEVVGNEIAYPGQGGVILLGSTETQPRDNLVAGNWIHHAGQVYKHVAGVYATTARGTRVAHNRIEHMPRYAISFKSFDGNNASHGNVAEYNDILFTNLETNDTGAIETLGRDRQDTGNVIQYNRILDVVGLKSMPDGTIRSPYFTWGIYLDDYSSGTTVRGNLVVRHDWGGGCIHGGRNNLFENNIFIEGMSHQMRYQVRDTFCANNRFVRNILFYSYPNADLYKHTGRWHEKVLAESDYNLAWHAQGAGFFQEHGPTPLGLWAQWQAAGFDTHSLIADPLFVDPAKDDYRLRPDSPAFKLGIRQLPWEKIGLQGYARAWKRHSQPSGRPAG